MRNLNIVIDRIFPAFVQTNYLLIIVFCLLYSCRSDDSIQQNELLGRWEITKAERNGRETNYLRRGYFVFDPQMLTVNITGADEKGSYSLHKNKIVMGNKNFELSMVQNDTMIVKYIAGPNSEFLFHMLKKRNKDVQ